MDQPGLYDDTAAIAEVLSQAPPHIGEHEAKVAYYNAKRSISDALAALWELPPLAEKPKPAGVNAEKWAEVRETCDEMDAAMNDSLSKLSQKNRNMEAPIVQSCDKV